MQRNRARCWLCPRHTHAHAINILIPGIAAHENTLLACWAFGMSGVSSVTFSTLNRLLCGRTWELGEIRLHVSGPGSGDKVREELRSAVTHSQWDFSDSEHRFHAEHSGWDFQFLLKHWTQSITKVGARQRTTSVPPQGAALTKKDQTWQAFSWWYFLTFVLFAKHVCSVPDTPGHLVQTQMATNLMTEEVPLEFTCYRYLYKCALSSSTWAHHHLWAPCGLSLWPIIRFPLAPSVWLNWVSMEIGSWEGVWATLQWLHNYSTTMMIPSESVAFILDWNIVHP